MTSPETQELLTFFKALADLNRLRIVGLLARQEHTVEALAAVLELADGTVSHHLRRLTKAGLVSARPDGHYRHYSLRQDVLEELAARLLGRGNLEPLADDLDLDNYDRKVLATFTDGEGRITAFPAQQKKFLVLVRHAAQAFEPGVRYSEREVNALLLPFNEDTARLRRALIDHRIMQRETGGRAYWLVEDSQAIRQPLGKSGVSR